MFRFLYKIRDGELFAVEPINGGRQIEIDLAKGFSILFMVWLHTVVKFGVLEGVGPAIVDHFLGGPFAAPVFMVSMGVGMCYTRKNAARDFLRRGLLLLCFGVLLNLCRYAIPGVIKSALAGAAVTPGEFFSSFFGVDILEFAGLTFIFFALLKKIHGKKEMLPTLPFIAVAFSLAGTVLTDVSTGSNIANQFCGFLWPSTADTNFPFFNWLIFPAFGFYFGNMLLRCRDKRKLYRRLAPLAGCVGLTYIIVAWRFGFGFYGADTNYYFPGILDAVMVLLLVVGIFGFNLFLAGRIPRLSQRILSDMSKNITAVYCVHWTILGFLGICLWSFISEDGLAFPGVTLLAFTIAVASAVTAHLWSRFKAACRR